MSPSLTLLSLVSDDEKTSPRCGDNNLYDEMKGVGSVRNILVVDMGEIAIWHMKLPIYRYVQLITLIQCCRSAFRVTCEQ